MFYVYVMWVGMYFLPILPAMFGVSIFRVFSACTIAAGKKQEYVALPTVYPFLKLALPQRFLKTFIVFLKN